MTSARLLAWRLASQYLDGRQAGDPARIVRHFGAVQAQEYAQSLWAVGLRTRDATAPSVEAAIESGAILRTWPMRGTIHLVPAEDARWMLDLLAGRRIRQMATVYRRLGLTEEVLGRAAEIVAGELRGGRRIRRPDLLALLAGCGIDCSASPHGSRGSHILGYLSMTGLVCIGPMDGTQQTFVLLGEWAPHPRRPEDPAAELAVRYFTSHGPATVRDFGWWSGLPLGQVRPAIERAGRALAATELGGEVYWHGNGQPGPASGDAGLATGGALLLPAFDEYTVAYKDRDALLADGHQLPPGDLLNPVMVLDGQVVGLWKRVITRDGVQLTLAPFGRLAKGDRDRFAVAARRYAAFLGLPAEIAAATPVQVRRQRRQLSRPLHTGGMPVRLHHIVIDTHDLPGLARFWTQALGWRILSEREREIVIGTDENAPVGICFMPVADPKTVKNRVHIDLTSGAEDREQEIERLISLGARRVDIGQTGQESWTVLADPEGNEFCVVRPKRTLID